MDPGLAPSLNKARALTRLLDTMVRIPGTNLRFGLDPLLGLIPGLGDVAGAGLAGYVVLLAAQNGASSSVILRMLGNVALDTALGSIPFLGDLFDAGWKSNSRNLALLERHLGQPQRTKRVSAVLVFGVLVGLALLAIGGLLFAIFLLRWVFGAGQ